MAWITKDKDGVETLWTTPKAPKRGKESWDYSEDEAVRCAFTDFPAGTFKTCPRWDEEPLEI